MSTVLKDSKFRAQNSKFKNQMIALTGIFGSCFVISAFASVFYKSSLLFSLAITFGVTFYHFAIRLVIGYSVDRIFKNGINYKNRWFSPKKFEQRLYKKLHVHKWKEKVPTFDPEQFDIEQHTFDEIISSMCVAEIVHEVIFVFALLPIVLSIPFGEFWVFFVTSFFSAAFDLIFVILQRYNRPRVIRLLNRKT